MAKLKNKPCNLTRKEWEFLLMVFNDYVENLDSSKSTVAMLEEIHTKLFFMDHIVKREEELEKITQLEETIKEQNGEINALLLVIKQYERGE
jgi:hypothetical protein